MKKQSRRRSAPKKSAARKRATKPTKAVKKAASGRGQKSDSPDTRIAIIGDVCVETFVVKLPNQRGDATSVYLGESEWECRRRKGGAWLIKSMLDAYVETANDGRLKTRADENNLTLNLDAQVVGATDPCVSDGEPPAKGGQQEKPVLTQGYPEWAIQLRPYPSKQTVSKSEMSPNDAVFRVSERLGRVVHRFGNDQAAGEQNRLPAQELFREDNLDQLKSLSKDDSPGILVINDRNEGFRSAIDEKRSTNADGSETAYKQKLTEEIVKACAGTKQDCPAIVWLLYRPAQQSPVWSILEKAEEQASKGSAKPGEGVWDNLVVVINEDCLRDAGIDIRFDIAYEEVIEDLLLAPTSDSENGFLGKLRKARHVLIRFENGVLHLERSPEQHRPETKSGDDAADNTAPTSKSTGGISIRFIEDFSGSWRVDDHGSMEGYTFLLATCLVHDIALAMKKDRQLTKKKGKFSRIANSIDWSLYLGCLHKHLGYGKKEDLQSDSADQAYVRLFLRAEQDRLRGREKDTMLFLRPEAHPVFRIGVVGSGEGSLDLRGDIWGYRREQLHEASRLNKPPNLKEVETAIAGSSENGAGGFFVQLVLQGLRRLAVRGPVELDAGAKLPAKRSQKGGDEIGPFVRSEPSFLLPYASFGQLMTADRSELSSFFAIERLLHRYLNSERNWKTPLAIGVFGPPGSGKNYTVKELIRSVNRKLVDDTLTFNLAQFETSAQLWQALRDVQDLVVAGKTPIAIFDEFDSSINNQKLGWLKYFLSPIQDGKFYDGSRTYNLGRSIMVFAGGTSHSYGDFIKAAETDKDQTKAPDFVSRLRGHLDIDPIEEPKIDAREEQLEDDYAPPNPIQFRRAVILRGLLHKNLPRIINPDTRVADIDEDVVRAFLEIPTFRHGVRSMEAILQMSNVAAVRDKLQKSSLPPFEQLDMHVNAKQFLKIVNRP